MNAPQQVTNAIVLARTDYGEADRIITLLTPDHGKLRLIAKGVRRVKSKLAGGIELFSVTNVTFIKGRGDIGTLVSARLETHYGRIVQDLQRTMLGYDLIKQLHKATEDEPEEEYFHLLHQSFAELNNLAVPLELIRLWFSAQLLRLSGHEPNLHTEPNGAKLIAGGRYEFSFDGEAFVSRTDGAFIADDIKFLRILFSASEPQAIAKIAGIGELTKRSTGVVMSMWRQFINH